MVQKQDEDVEATFPWCDRFFRNIVNIQDKDKGTIGEFQHLFKSKTVNIISGVGYFDGKKDVLNKIFGKVSSAAMDTRHTNFYFYSDINFPRNMTWSLGTSADFFEVYDTRNQLNPKIGVSWNPWPSSTLRMAAFRTMTRTLISNQTIEPTQVSGFNQFYDDPPGTDVRKYGIAVDQDFSSSVFGGMEFSNRKLNVPEIDVKTNKTISTDWEEWLTRAYFYWIPHPWWAATLEWYHEKFDREFPSNGVYIGELEHLDTHRLPLGLNFFHPCGLIARLRTSYVDQTGRYMGFEPETASDQFWVVDASIGYRLPNRLGLISLEIRNLFDSEFKFHEMDSANPLMNPSQLIFLRFTLVF
jgi:hypothetical protein